jgi:hypothetical protein
MSQEVKQAEVRKKFTLTTDGSAVLTALALALLVRLGVVRHLPW